MDESSRFALLLPAPRPSAQTSSYGDMPKRCVLESDHVRSKQVQESFVSQEVKKAFGSLVSACAVRRRSFEQAG